MKKILILVLVIAIIILSGVLVYKIKNLWHEGPLILPSDHRDLIRVENPKPGQVIQSPFTIIGQARGNWFFEASFPVKLVDLSGNIISQAIAQAQGDWMTENFVPFSAVLNFDIATPTMPAILILKNDNPSGIPENDKEIRIPVTLQNLNIAQRTVKLYYYNSNLDKDDTGNVLCSEKGLVAVEREIPITQTPIQDTINLLLKGQLTSQERDKGITAGYPLEGFGLEAASLNNGVLTLTFEDQNNKSGGGSCRVGILWFQIEATAKQFSEVKEVKFMPEELFQP